MTTMKTLMMMMMMIIIIFPNCLILSNEHFLHTKLLLAFNANIISVYLNISAWLLFGWRCTSSLKRGANDCKVSLSQAIKYSFGTCQPGAKQAFGLAIIVR